VRYCTWDGDCIKHEVNFEKKEAKKGMMMEGCQFWEFNTFVGATPLDAEKAKAMV